MIALDVEFYVEFPYLSLSFFSVKFLSLKFISLSVSFFLYNLIYKGVQHQHAKQSDTGIRLCVDGRHGLECTNRCVDFELNDHFSRTVGGLLWRPSGQRYKNHVYIAGHNQRRILVLFDVLADRWSNKHTQRTIFW